MRGGRQWQLRFSFFFIILSLKANLGGPGSSLWTFDLHITHHRLAIAYRLSH
jgi:hypothetical protein